MSDEQPDLDKFVFIEAETQEETERVEKQLANEKKRVKKVEVWVRRPEERGEVALSGPGRTVCKQIID